MKKLLLFICAAMMIFSCGKEESGNKPSVDQVDKVTWATVVHSWTAFLYLTGKSRIGSIKNSAA